MRYVKRFSSGRGNLNVNSYSIANIRALNLHDTTHNPVALYQFQNDLSDSSGNNLHLTALSGSPNYSETLYGKTGLYFDTPYAAYLNGDNSSLQLTGDVTIEFIFKIKSFPFAYMQFLKMERIVAGSNNEEDNILYTLFLTNTGQFLYGQEYGAGNQETFVTNASSSLQTNTLYHVAVVRESNVITFYVNGSQFGDNQQFETPTGGESGSLVVGIYQNIYPDSIFASLKIISGSITQSEVLEEYKRTVGTVY